MNLLKSAIIPVVESVTKDIGIEPELFLSVLKESNEEGKGELVLPCFAFAKILSKSPLEIASLISEKMNDIILSDEILSNMMKIVPVNAYVNIHADLSWLLKWAIHDVISDPDKAGRSDSTGRHVLLEHTSANPNGPFHVGRSRNAILGDAMVRLHRHNGDKVTSEYYVDDMGKQVAILAWALENLNEEIVSKILVDAGIEETERTDLWSGKPDHERVRWYQAANILLKDDESIGEALGEMVRLSEEGDLGMIARFEDAYKPVLDGMLETLARLGITYDSFTPESRFILDGSVTNVSNLLSNSELCGVAENGALYLELEKKGLSGNKSTKFFFQRSDGSSLYPTRDVAYHQWKWTQADELLNILGEDHRLQSKQVSAALDELEIKSPEVLFYSFVKMPEGKMSTRRGNVVFMDDLISEAIAQAESAVMERRKDLSKDKITEISEAVGISAVRFNVLRFNPDFGFTFKWEEALSFEANSAPFIMYSHTRACSIINKLKLEGHDVNSLINNWSPQKLADSEQPASLGRMVRCLARFKDEISKSVVQKRPNLFCSYLLELATSFNSFYRDCKVLYDGKVDVNYLVISETARLLLKSGCEALGIIPLEEM